MPVLTAQDRAFFDANGYVVVREAAPPELCDAVISAIWDFLGMDRHNPDDWYRPPLQPGGMLEMYQHQALWDTRQHPRIHEAFADLWETPRLCVTIDRAGLKPPQNPSQPEYDHKGFTHWDTDTRVRPLPFGLQGVLCLENTDANQGGFQCVPGFHRNLEAWCNAQPADRNPHAPDLSCLPGGMQVTPIPARKGDLIIWHVCLAHGNGHNVSGKPRYSQYISMFPAERLTDEARAHRVACWQERRAPSNNVFPGDPRHWEEQTQPTAYLSLLGRRLLGLEAWE